MCGETVVLASKRQLIDGLKSPQFQLIVVVVVSIIIVITRPIIFPFSARSG